MLDALRNAGVEVLDDGGVERKATVMKTKRNEAALRRMAKKLGYSLIQPQRGVQSGIGDIGACYVLVPLNSGMSIEEVEAFLERAAGQAQPISRLGIVFH